MRYASRTLIVLVASMLVAVAGQYASAQQNQKKQPKPNPSQQAATDAAKNAKDLQGKADAAKKAVAAANDAFRAAQKDVDDANKALKKIEDDTIDAQPAESDFGKARDAYRGAEKKYQDARKSVLEDESFKARLAAAREADDSATALLALHKEFDEMPVIADSHTAMQSAKEVYDPLKAKLLQGTQEWVSANDDLKAKKTALEEARHKFNEATSAAARAKLAARKAELDAARAAAAQQPNQQNNNRRRHVYY